MTENSYTPEVTGLGPAICPACLTEMDGAHPGRPCENCGGADLTAAEWDGLALSGDLAIAEPCPHCWRSEGCACPAEEDALEGLRAYHQGRLNADVAAVAGCRAAARRLHAAGILCWYHPEVPTSLTVSADTPAALVRIRRALGAPLVLSEYRYPLDPTRVQLHFGCAKYPGLCVTMPRAVRPDDPCQITEQTYLGLSCRS